MFGVAEVADLQQRHVTCVGIASKQQILQLQISIRHALHSSASGANKRD